MAAAESSKTIYVGGFSNQTNAGLVHSAFTCFGDIVDIQLPPDPSHQAPHKGFAFVTYATVASALDAIDNMHSNILPGATNGGRVLKVNMAKPSKGLQKGGSNRAIWTDEAWIKEHGLGPEGEKELGSAAMAEDADSS